MQRKQNTILIPERNILQAASLIVIFFARKICGDGWPDIFRYIIYFDWCMHAAMLRAGDAQGQSTTTLALPQHTA